MKKRINLAQKFFTKTIWESHEGYSKYKRLGISILRVLLISIRGFNENKNALKSSALTFYAILSVVPVFAVAFGVAQGFGFEDKLESQIRLTFAGQEEVMNKIIEFSRTSLENVSGGLVAGISILFLLWSVIKLLNHIENALNAIWNLKKSRTFIRKFTDYLSLILVGPIFILLSSSVTVFINTALQDLNKGGLFIEWTSSFILTLMQLAPFILLWILFTILYMIIPNKNVKFLPALAGGIIAGTAFAFLQNGYVYFQLAMSRYNAIYGSFAALPLFLIWLQISWLFILFGAEISHAMQYSQRLIHARQSKNLSNRITKLLCLNVLNEIAQAFENNQKALDTNQLAEKLNLPLNYIEKAISNLLDAELITVVHVKGNNKNKAFNPATSIENLKLASILSALERAGVNHLAFEKTEQFTLLDKKMHELEESLEKQTLNVPITHLSF